MAKIQLIEAVANDGTGDNLVQVQKKSTLNFDEIYTAIGDGTQH